MASLSNGTSRCGSKEAASGVVVDAHAFVAKRETAVKFTREILANTAAKSGTLLGVFISVTTIPAAGFAAPAAVAGDWSRCLEALAMLGINVVGVALAAVVTLWLRREHVTLGAHRRSAHRRSSARGHQG